MKNQLLEKERAIQEQIDLLRDSLSHFENTWVTYESEERAEPWVSKKGVFYDTKGCETISMVILEKFEELAQRCREHEPFQLYTNYRVTTDEEWGLVVKFNVFTRLTDEG